MYDELVALLRKKYDKAPMVMEAADAIEELDKLLDGVSADNDSLCEKIERMQKPRWIPVTERLPEENQIVVAHEGKGTWDFGMFRGISASGNPEYWRWKKNTFKRVKWWMPKDDALPEPPKEET